MGKVLTMADFKLDKRLEEDTVEVHTLRLCEVRLMNDKRYPWLVLVPKVSGAEEILDLNDSNYESLSYEIRKVSKVLSQEFKPYKINIASLGNVVRQLHVHVVARFESDFAWPGPVWGVGESAPYEEGELEEIVKKIKDALR